MTRKSRVIVRTADICPCCSAINSIIIDNGFRARGVVRVAYGKCERCKNRVTLYEVRPKMPTE